MTDASTPTVRYWRVLGSEDVTATSSQLVGQMLADHPHAVEVYPQTAAELAAIKAEATARGWAEALDAVDDAGLLHARQTNPYKRIARTPDQTGDTP